MSAVATKKGREKRVNRIEEAVGMVGGGARGSNVGVEEKTLL